MDIAGNSRGNLGKTVRFSHKEAVIPLVCSSFRQKGKTSVIIQTASGDSVTQTVPAGLTLSVKVKDIVKADQSLTYDPNVGGFGQSETEIILQNPNRVKGMIVFFFTVTVAQILLVIKKKQFEKVQAAEMNF